MEASIDDPFILITDRKISAVQDILPLLEQMTGQGKRDFVIVAEDVDGEALATLVVNRLRGILTVLAVKAPGFGDRRKEMLRDLAILTGGQVISEEMGCRLDAAQLSDLGHARRVISTKDATTFVEGRGQPAEIEGRIRQVKAQIAETTSDFDREKLQERLAKLSGGVALLNAVGALERVHLQGDAATDVGLLRRVLEEPRRQIAANSGLDGAVIVEGVRRAQQEHHSDHHGYNVQSSR